jgi:hypothetical protein
VHCTSPWRELLTTTSHVPDQLLRLIEAGRADNLRRVERVRRVTETCQRGWVEEGGTCACLCSFALSRLLLTSFSDRDIKEQA